uniref:Uncharacterized protein LOC116304933 n=1 Tax=Actinia tenebrosa TaxID=6105 RepID=A0A6P8IUH9_ACTTE
METVLDQFNNDSLETIHEEEPIVNENKPIRKKKSTVKKDDSVDVEEKREQLYILAVLGTIEVYTGNKMSLGDVKKLSAKDVDRFYNRYQVIMGAQVAGTLVDTTIDAATELTSYILPIDNKKSLSRDLKENQMIRQELTNAAGYAILKGGRFIALATGLFQVAKHIDRNHTSNKEAVEDMDKMSENDSTQIEQITKTPEQKVERIKDPKKVAADKRLADYHKRAKRALKADTDTEEKDNGEHKWMPEISLTTALTMMEAGGIDFDPLTEEGKANVNEEIDGNFLDYEDVYEKDTSGVGLYQQLKARFGKYARFAYNGIRDRLTRVNPKNKLPEYMELDNVDEKESNERNSEVLYNEILRRYPEFDYDGDYEKLFKNFQIVDGNEIEVRAPNGTKWYVLSPDDTKIPKQLRKTLGWSREHIDRYDQGKKDLDMYFPNNTITRENGFDIRTSKDHYVEVFDPNIVKGKKEGGWYGILTKGFEAYSEKSFGKMTNRIKSNLGESADTLLKNLAAKESENDQELQHVYAKVEVINHKQDEINDEKEANSDRLSNLGDFIEEHYDRLVNNDLSEEEMDNASSIFELHYNSHDHKDGTITQIEALQQRRDEIRKENNKLIDTNEQLKQEEAQHEDRIRELVNERQEIQNERESIEEKLPLRERVKQIIKRHGLTVTGIALAVGTIIGVIINSLKAGLTSVAKGVGNGLKTIGKKLAQILPGMVGAIASFIFRTAGEVVGFLAKNAWLLIVAVVLYIIERYKKKK